MEGNQGQDPVLRLPPTKTCGCFNEGILREQPRLPAGKKSLVGPNEDVQSERRWARSAFARLAELGVEVAGIYGSHFRVPEGFDRNRATEQALRYCRILGEAARPYRIRIALEPTADPTSVFPSYIDGLNFARCTGMPEVRVMADINYFIRGNWDYNDIAIQPDYCLHVHLANDHAQPGEGNRTELFLRLFAVLRRIGYTRSVCAAAPWVSTTGGPLNYRAETAKCLSEDTISILRGLKEKYEVHHGVHITDAAIVAAATLSNRYIADRFLPDKAIDLIDEAASRQRMQVEFQAGRARRTRPPHHPAQDRAGGAEEGDRRRLARPAGQARRASSTSCKRSPTR